MQGGWPRRFVLVQVPNAPLAVALASAVAGRLTHGSAHAVAGAMFYGSLAIWAWGEAVDGVNWFRRALGVGFLVYVVVRLTGVLR